MISPFEPGAADGLAAGCPIRALGMAMFSEVEGRLAPLFYCYHGYHGLLFMWMSGSVDPGLMGCHHQPGGSCVEYLWSAEPNDPHQWRSR